MVFVFGYVRVYVLYCIVCIINKFLVCGFCLKWTHTHKNVKAKILKSGKCKTKKDEGLYETRRRVGMPYGGQTLHIERGKVNGQLLI